MKERGWRWVSAASTWDKGNRAPASACVPVGGKRRGGCLRRVEGAANRGATTRGVERARRAACEHAVRRGWPADVASDAASSSTTSTAGKKSGIRPTAPFGRPTAPSREKTVEIFGLTSVSRSDRGGSKTVADAPPRATRRLEPARSSSSSANGFSCVCARTLDPRSPSPTRRTLPVARLILSV